MNPFIFAVSAPLALFHGRSVSCGGGAAMDKDARGRRANKKAGGKLNRTAPPCSASLPTLIHIGRRRLPLATVSGSFQSIAAARLTSSS